MLNFLQANNIMDMAWGDEKFKSMIGEQLDIQGKLKPAVLVMSFSFALQTGIGITHILLNMFNMSS